jgi:hypothetical protein
MKTATFLRQLKREDNRINARLYRLSEPMASYTWRNNAEEHSEYVVVSGSMMFGEDRPETYIFLADESGEITNWIECAGSFQGSIDHVQALSNAGYAIVEGE